MAKSNKEKMDWETRDWLSHFVFYLGTSTFFFLALNNPSKGIHEAIWLYYIISTVLLIVASANAVFFKDSIRYFIGLTMIVLNIFIIPLSCFAYTGNASLAVAASLLYVIIIIAISPNLVSGTALLAAIVFGCFFYMENNRFTIKDTFSDIKLKKKLVKDKGENKAKTTKEVIEYYYKVEEPQTLQEISAEPEVYGTPEYWRLILKANKDKIDDPTKLIPQGTILKISYAEPEIRDDILKISLAYIAGALIAIFWRILIKKMYQFYSVSIDKTSALATKNSEETKEKLDQLANENRLLKEEMAIQIIEMNSIISTKES